MTRADLIENLNVLCRHLRSIDLDVAANVCERAAEQIATDGETLDRLVAAVFARDVDAQQQICGDWELKKARQG